MTVCLSAASLSQTIAIPGLLSQTVATPGPCVFVPARCPPSSTGLLAQARTCNAATTAASDHLMSGNSTVLLSSLTVQVVMTWHEQGCAKLQGWY